MGIKVLSCIGINYLYLKYFETSLISYGCIYSWLQTC